MAGTSGSTITVYVDGSCDNRDGTGGWAFVVDDEHETTASGYVSESTSNRMELYAPILALLKLYLWYGPSKILVRSDSRYVVLGITRPDRARNKNLDLWNELEDAIQLHDKVKWKWVRGHAGNKQHNLADKLANQARKHSNGNSDGRHL